jgi:hypothetical protein
MRIFYFGSLICLAALVHPVVAAERCQEISDMVAAAVVAKPKIVDQLKKKPEKGTLGEPWRYLWFINTERVDALRMPSEEQQYMFKTIGSLSFSRKLEVDMDIFRDYFYLRCKRKEKGLATIPLASIPAASLIHCWDAVASRPQFQGCMEKLLEGSDKPKKGR